MGSAGSDCVPRVLIGAFVVVAAILAVSPGASAKGHPVAVPAPESVNGAAAPADPSATSCPDCGEAGRDPASVFFVQRNKNRNEVHYGIRLDAECRPVGDEPVYNYWLRLEKGPNVTEPVTLFQQAGYGLRSQHATTEHVDVVLRSLPQRTIRLVPVRAGVGCRALAYMYIAGASCRFERAYVFAEEGFFMPKVKYIELFGAAQDGAPVTEHVAVD